MSQSRGDSCLFYYRCNNKLAGLIIAHVDDFLAAGGDDFQKYVMDVFLNKFSFGKVHDKFSYTGISIHQEKDETIYIDQNEFVQNLPTFNYTKQDSQNILDKTENGWIRKTTGQLNWMASQTRPDISYDAFHLSTCLNRAKYEDAKYSTRAVLKSKYEDVKLRFSRLGSLADLHLELYVDAALGNVEEGEKTKSMMGYFIALCDKKGNFSPLHWKSKVIDKVTPDIKTAETMALEIALDDAIFMSKVISELYTGEKNKNNIPIVIMKILNPLWKV